MAETKKSLKDSVQDLRLSTLERKSDVKDLEHDESFGNQKAVNKYVNDKIKDNDATDSAQQQKIDDLEKKLDGTRKALLAISLVSVAAFVSGLVSLVL